GHPHLRRDDDPRRGRGAVHPDPARAGAGRVGGGGVDLAGLGAHAGGPDAARRGLTPRRGHAHRRARQRRRRGLRPRRQRRPAPAERPGDRVVAGGGRRRRLVRRAPHRRHVLSRWLAGTTVAGGLALLAAGSVVSIVAVGIGWLIG